MPAVTVKMLLAGGMLGVSGDNSQNAQVIWMASCQQQNGLLYSWDQFRQSNFHLLSFAKKCQLLENRHTGLEAVI